ncbi:MAG: ABC transporter [Spirochaetaceae bacterium]|nr:MAG: ABC transporter [Spirochaetaceae bacterium]
MKRKQQETITLLMTLLVLILVGLNSVYFFVRLDLTEQRAYTLADVSRRLAREMPESARITYFLSDRLRARAVETEQIADLLYEYAAQSRANIEVDVVDPAAAGLSAEVESLGVAPQQIQVIEQDQRSLATVYSGIVIEYLDRYHTLPVVIDPRIFEYELTSALRNLVHDRTPQLGFVLGRRDEELAREYQLTASRLSRRFGLRTLAAGEPVPPDIDAVFVIGGRDLSDADLSVIRDFIARGGRALFAVDGVIIDLETPNLAAVAAPRRPIDELLLQYGVRIRRKIVLDEFHRSIPVARPSGTMTVQSLEPYPPWVSVRNYNDTHPVSARFTGLDLYWPSPLDLDAEGEFEVLLESSASAWLMGEPFVTSPLQPAALQRDAAQTRGRYVLAAAVGGTQEAPARVVVVGDSDFLSNLLQYTGSGHNVDFAENLAAWLTLDDELLSLRTRAARDLRLSRIEDPVARRRVAGFAQLVNVYLIPLSVVLFGVARHLRRRSRTRGGTDQRSLTQ